MIMLKKDTYKPPNKIKISTFYENKNKKILNIDGTDDMVKIINLNTLLDITIMILFDHYL